MSVEDFIQEWEKKQEVELSYIWVPYIFMPANTIIVTGKSNLLKRIKSRYELTQITGDFR